MFAKCLEKLKQIATDVVNERHLKSTKDNPTADVMYKPEQIQWVITIPAIWSISAKKFMREAAYKVTSVRDDEYMNEIIWMSDHRSYECNYKPEKNSGFNGIWTHDLRVTSAMLYQLSYEATHWEQVNCEFIDPW